VDAVAEPPEPVQVRVYVVEFGGDTLSLPPVDFDPDHPPEDGLDDALQESAYWELQLSSVVFPEVMV
jgi:hypothetical protein